jgi:hypothetical protein
MKNYNSNEIIFDNLSNTTKQNNVNVSKSISKEFKIKINKFCIIKPFIIQTLLISIVFILIEFKYKVDIFFSNLQII